MTKLRKMTIGEVAEIAATPRDTLRGWINRGTVTYEKNPGWMRFSALDVIEIAAYARAMRVLDHDAKARHVAIFLRESFENFAAPPHRKFRRAGQMADQVLIFRRNALTGLLDYRYFFGADVVDHQLGVYRADTAEVDWASFEVVNLATIADWVMDRIFDCQEIDGDEVSV
jgi:DNA-binding transcriptional MerR regulator